MLPGEKAGLDVSECIRVKEQQGDIIPSVFANTKEIDDVYMAESCYIIWSHNNITS